MKKNEVLECLKTRRSIRAFEPDKMPSKELVAKVVEAGTFAPTGVLVVLADRSRPTYLYDGSLVMGNLLNAAHALGLGSCWIHRAKEVFDSEEGRDLLRQWGIEGDYEGIGHCVLGYSKDGKEPQAAPRKSDYVRYV